MWSSTKVIVYISKSKHVLWGIVLTHDVWLMILLTLGIERWQAFHFVSQLLKRIKRLQESRSGCKTVCLL